MMDLVCLVADKSMKATVETLLDRHHNLGTRRIEHEVVSHPGCDPGVFNDAANFLQDYRGEAHHALVMLDLDWDGCPARSAAELERLLAMKLRAAGMDGWAEPIVIEPELENWVWSDSPHVDACLGWAGRTPSLREWLDAEGLWPQERPKPEDPKGAYLAALDEVQEQKSSSIFRDLAEKVSVERCTDAAFLRFKEVLRRWFPPVAAARTR